MVSLGRSLLLLLCLLLKFFLIMLLVDLVDVQGQATQLQLVDGDVVDALPFVRFHGFGLSTIV